MKHLTYLFLVFSLTIPRQSNAGDTDNRMVFGLDRSGTVLRYPPLSPEEENKRLLDDGLDKIIVQVGHSLSGLENKDVKKVINSTSINLVSDILKKEIGHKYPDIDAIIKRSIIKKLLKQSMEKETYNNERFFISNRSTALVVNMLYNPNNKVAEVLYILFKVASKAIEVDMDHLQDDNRVRKERMYEVIKEEIERNQLQSLPSEFINTELARLVRAIESKGKDTPKPVVQEDKINPKSPQQVTSTDLCKNTF